MLILIILFVLCFLICFRLLNLKRNLPKGLKECPLVKSWPIVGILPQIKAPMYDFFMKLAKTYGPIYRIRFGMREMVILNNDDLVRKALVNNSDSFSGRSTTQKYTFLCMNSGIIFLDNHVWSIQRPFLSKVLRDFGMGNCKSVEIAQSECLMLLDDLAKKGGQSVDVKNLFYDCTANIIAKFVMNKRVTSTDSLFRLMKDMQNRIVKQKDLVQFFLLMFPIFDSWDWFNRFFVFITFRHRIFERIHVKWQEVIEDHLKTVDFDCEGDDLIERFLIKKNQLLQQEKSVKTFTDMQLIRNSLELFVAGFDTTATTLVWSMMFMAKHIKIQEQVYDEIIDKIGKERLPTLSDKKSLSYTQAVIDEILRMSSVAPMAIIHRTTKDAVVDGYFIPENTLIIPNIYACHYDPKIWETPNEFSPNHFLSKNSTGELKYNAREELIPFSLGKRQCLGESLARTEFFIFFTTILQRFRVQFSKPLSDSDYRSAIRGNDGVLRVCSVTDYSFEIRD